MGRTLFSRIPAPEPVFFVDLQVALRFDVIYIMLVQDVQAITGCLYPSCRSSRRRWYTMTAEALLLTVQGQVVGVLVGNHLRHHTRPGNGLVGYLLGQLGNEHPGIRIAFEHILASDVAFDVGLGRNNFELVGNQFADALHTGQVSFWFDV